VLDGLLECLWLFHNKNFSKSTMVSQGIYCPKWPLLHGVCRNSSDPKGAA
jgi:hypothetical protein